MMILKTLLLGLLLSASDYPVSDHYDGNRFFNPSGSAPKGFWQLLKWWSEDKEEWPEERLNPDTPDLAKIVPRGEVHITFINHASFLIRTWEWSVLTDPHFSERASPVSFAGPKRVRRPAYEADELPVVDHILISHNHYDHLDIESLKDLEKRFEPQKWVPLGNSRLLKSKRLGAVQELDWWESQTLGGLKISLVPAEHWSARGIFDRNQALWGGYYLQWEGFGIYFAGDTGYGEFFKDVRKRMGAPNVALLPIGAYEPRWFMKENHMNPMEAVQSHLDLASQLSLGMHFGTFQLTNEGIDDPLEALEKARQELGVGAEQFRAPEFGETLVFKL